MMAATSARGETEIMNAAREPEVADLAQCLVAMGAKIEGAGTHRILDRRAARPCRLPATRSSRIASRPAPTRSRPPSPAGSSSSPARGWSTSSRWCQALEAAGVQIWPTDRGLMVSRTGGLKGVDITTEPYPGFPTDLQAQFMALMCSRRARR